MRTIADWERERFEREAAAELDTIEVAEPARTIVGGTDIAVPKGIVAVRGRVTAGLGVQLLIEPWDAGRAWITVDVAGRTQTFEVPPGDANEAFDHPYAYGASLAL